jgi:hypothetical protein
VQWISPRGGRWTLLAGVVLAGLAAGYVMTIAGLWAGKVRGLVAFRGELGQILNRTSHEMHVSRPDPLPLRSGMSWSKAGSHALTALNAVVLNGGVQQWVRQREIAFEFAVKAA